MSFIDDDLDCFFEDFKDDKQATFLGKDIDILFNTDPSIDDGGFLGREVSYRPSVTVKTSDTTDIKVDSPLIRNQTGQKYLVRDWSHNSSGLTEVELYEDNT